MNDISTLPMKNPKSTIQGFPRGRLTLIYGDEGKTSLCLQEIARLTTQGGNVMYVDLDDKMTEKYALSAGVNLAGFEIVKPSTRREVLTSLLTGIEERVDMIVFDSLGHIFPYEPGPNTQYWSGILPRACDILEKSSVAWVVAAKEENSRPLGGMAWRYVSALTLRTHDGQIDVIKDRLTERG